MREVTNLLAFCELHLPRMLRCFLCPPRLEIRISIAAPILRKRKRTCSHQHRLENNHPILCARKEFWRDSIIWHRCLKYIPSMRKRRHCWTSGTSSQALAFSPPSPSTSHHRLKRWFGETVGRMVHNRLHSQLQPDNATYRNRVTALIIIEIHEDS